MKDIDHSEHHQYYINEVVKRNNNLSTIIHMDIGACLTLDIGFFKSASLLYTNYNDIYNLIHNKIMKIIIIELINQGGLEGVSEILTKVLLIEINIIFEENNLNLLEEDINLTELMLNVVTIYNKLCYVLKTNNVDIKYKLIVMAINYTSDDKVCYLTLGIEKDTHGVRRDRFI